MATCERSNPGSFTVLAKALRDLDGLVAKAGWFKSSVYENGMPVAQIAIVQEYGASINHPGGTAYSVGRDGAKFVSNSSSGADSLPRTKAHKITIPPRPFMRPTIANEQKNWLRLLADGAKAVLRGKRTAQQVMDVVSAKAAGDVAKTIAALHSPPLAKSTIDKRRRQMADKKTIGSLDKPLVHSGLLLNSITNVVEKE